MIDTQDAFEQALNSTNLDQVMRVARQLANVSGWEEEARTLYEQAVRLSDEEWSYDRAVDNSL